MDGDGQESVGGVGEREAGRLPLDELSRPADIAGSCSATVVSECAQSRATPKTRAGAREAHREWAVRCSVGGRRAGIMSATQGAVGRG